MRVVLFFLTSGAVQAANVQPSVWLIVGFSPKLQSAWLLKAGDTKARRGFSER